MRLTDPRFMRHASSDGPFGMRFYAAVPIRDAMGKPVGLLGVFDKPRQMSIDEQQALQDLSLSAAEFLRIRERAAPRWCRCRPIPRTPASCRRSCGTRRESSRCFRARAS